MKPTKPDANARAMVDIRVNPGDPPKRAIVRVSDGILAPEQVEYLYNLLFCTEMDDAGRITTQGQL